jgi:Na+-transporting NADH:ubiquinone oxidoreductase subunit NqrB
MTRDIRNLQILFLTVFLYYGINILKWDISYQNVLALILSAVITQSIFALSFQLSVKSLKSALITSLSLALLMRSSQNFVFVLAGFFAISSKFLFTYRKKHLFNPANFGIITIIFFTGIGWITPSEWDFKSVLFFISGTISIMILSKIEKYDIAILFFGLYFVMSFLYQCVYLHNSFQNVLSEITNGSFVVLTFFMIIDPTTSPNNKKARYIWIIGNVILSFYLYNFINISVGAGIYALFIMAFVTPILDQLFSGNKFSWDSTDKSRKLFTNNELGL